MEGTAAGTAGYIKLTRRCLDHCVMTVDSLASELPAALRGVVSERPQRWYPRKPSVSLFALVSARSLKRLSSFLCHMTSATFSVKPYYSASTTSGGGVPSSSREKESQHEDDSIDGHRRWCSGSLGRWCHVDRTIGPG
jgi:hypothetical protein